MSFSSSSHLSFQQYHPPHPFVGSEQSLWKPQSPFYSLWPPTRSPAVTHTTQQQQRLNPLHIQHSQSPKRPLPDDQDDDGSDEEMLDSTTPVQSQPPSTPDDREAVKIDRDDLFPKKKRRKTDTADVVAGEGLIPDEAARSSHMSKTGSFTLQVDDDEVFDGYLDVRGTGSPPEEDKVDDGSEENTTASFHSLPLVLLPRLPTISISSSLPPASLPKNMTSSGRPNRLWSYEDPDGMETFGEDGRNEMQEEGTMVIYRPPLSLEISDLDEVAEGVKGMDLD